MTHWDYIGLAGFLGTAASFAGLTGITLAFCAVGAYFSRNVGDRKEAATFMAKLSAGFMVAASLFLLACMSAIYEGK